MSRITWNESLVNTKYFNNWEMFDYEDASITKAFCENKINSILSVCIDEFAYLLAKQEDEIFDKQFLEVEDEEFNYLYERTKKLILNLIKINIHFIEKYCDKIGWNSKYKNRLNQLNILFEEHDFEFV